MDLFAYLKNALPILGVVQDVVQVRPAGHYWKGSCPFHSETDASFTVSPDRQIFYCFGCHASGDVIAFIAKKENCSQIEAAKFIIDRYNISVPAEILRGAQKAMQGASVEEKNRYYLVYERFAYWCHQSLKKNASAHMYVKQRNLSDEIIQQFSIGYFPGGLQPVQQLVSAMANEGIMVKDLIAFGLLGEKKSYYYSPFEERILFPIKDHMGRVCAFGGRVFKQGDERAKYYNSRESEWFIKGKTLYGLDVAKKAMQVSGKAFLVEGYMDCVMMAQHGFAATVATLGTACTLEHLKLLARYVHTLYVLYDGDNAGQSAILRIAEFCWEASIDLEVVMLPRKEDPASFLEKKGDLPALIERAQGIFNFFVTTHVKDFHSKPMAGKIASMHKVFDGVLRISDPMKRDLLLQQAALAVDLPFQSLKDGLAFYARTLPGVRSGGPEVAVLAVDLEKNGDCDVSELEQKILYGILTHLRDQHFFIEAKLIPYFSPLVQGILIKIVDQWHDEAAFQSGDTRDLSFNQEERALVERVLMSFDTVMIDATFTQLKNLFYKNNWKRIAGDFKEKIRMAQLVNDGVRVQELVEAFSQLKQEFADKGLI